MYKRSIKLLIGVLLIVLSLGISNNSASAQINNGSIITTSPISVNLATKPGSQISTNLEVQNDSSKPITIGVTLEEFKANGNNGQAQIYIPPPNTPSMNWVHFSRTSFNALPNVWNSITMTIDLPRTASLGYYYAVLFSPEYSPGISSNTKIKGANAILVLLDAQTSADNYNLLIKSFVSTKTIYQYLPADFKIDVTNKGNIFSAPQGDIYITRSLNGPSIASIPFNSSGGNVLPGSNRVFTASWTNGFPVYQLKRYQNQVVSSKNGIPETTLNWNFKNISNFRIGRYYAHLVLVYSNGTRDIPVQSIVSFWVLPWVMIIVLLVIIAILCLGIWTLFKPFIKKTFNSAYSRHKKLKRRS